MKQQIYSVGLALILTNSAHAIAEATPDKELSLEQVPSQSNQPASPLAPSSRGELLYVNQCLGCHESNVHIREKQKAKTIPAIRGEVTRWAKELQLKWTLRDIADVVDYLNSRYYHYSE